LVEVTETIAQAIVARGLPILLTRDFCFLNCGVGKWNTPTAPKGLPVTI
jgi:hypothetical protein